jgi:hypothetical protein
MVRDPHAHGLSEAPADVEVAERVARWLAEKNNGHSVDWNRKIQDHHGDEDAAVQEFINDYLTANADGFHFIDRLWNAASRDDPTRRRVIGVSDTDARSILRVAEKEYESGVLRYRFECWLFAWLREVRGIAYSKKRSGMLRMTEMETGRGVETAVVLEISRGWMKDKWPFGSGENEEGTVRYVEFREVLYSRDLMHMHEPHRTKGYMGAERNIATRYAVPARIINRTVRLRDLPADPKNVLRVLEMETDSRDFVTLAEAMHALFVRKALPNRKEREARYKRASASRIKTLAAMVNEGIQLLAREEQLASRDT